MTSAKCFFYLVKNVILRLGIAFPQLRQEGDKPLVGGKGLRIAFFREPRFVGCHGIVLLILADRLQIVIRAAPFGKLVNLS